MASRHDEETARFAVGEVADADLGDERLNARVSKVLGAFVNHPEKSIPAASSDWAATKGTYRLFDNDRVTPEKLLEPHVAKAVDRCREHDTVLAIGDTTSLDFSSRKEMLGVGPLSGAKEKCGLGIHLHSTILASESGIPLGVADNFAWVRDIEEQGNRVHRCKNLPIEKKESRKWLRSIEVARDIQESLGDETQVVAVFDREGDIYSVLHDGINEQGVDLLIRAIHNRKIRNGDGEKRLWALVEEHELGQVTITVPRARKRDEREAILALHACTVTINEPPKRPAAETREGPITLTAVWAKEVTPGRRSGLVNWKLLTTLPVESLEDAHRIVNLYSRRWLIEIFFRTLKSGCKIEDRAFETAERLLNCLALDSIVAWTVMYLTAIGRQSPDLPCTTIFTDSEWKAAWVIANQKRKPPPKPPTLREITLIIGRLGGHLGRKGDGMPGAQTLWRGLQRLADLTAMWMALTED